MWIYSGTQTRVEPADCWSCCSLNVESLWTLLGLGNSKSRCVLRLLAIGDSESCKYSNTEERGQYFPRFVSSELFSYSFLSKHERKDSVRGNKKMNNCPCIRKKKTFSNLGKQWTGWRGGTHHLIFSVLWCVVLNLKIKRCLSAVPRCYKTLLWCIFVR